MSEKLRNLLSSLKSGRFLTLIRDKLFSKKTNHEIDEDINLDADYVDNDLTSSDSPPMQLPEASEDSGIKKFYSQFKNSLSPFAKKQGRIISKFVSNLKLKQKMDQTVGKIDWNQLYNSIMAPEYRTRVNHIFCLLITAAITYSVGKLIAAAINIPNISKKDLSRDYSYIGATSSRNSYDPGLEMLKSSNPFDAVVSLEIIAGPQTQGKKKEEVLVCRKAENQSGLPIKLMSTIVLQDSVKSVASVQVRNTEGISFREGDDIRGLARIGKIEPEKIIIKNLSSTECEYISSGTRSSSKNFKIFSAEEGGKLINQANESSIHNSGNNFKISKKYRDQQLVNLSLLLTQARALPINNPDGTISYKFTEIVPDSLYTKLGMQNGDIVHKINGSPIRSMNQVMSFFGQIKEVNHYEIEITRNGALTNLSYDFTE